ncbi:MAG: GNAT family N-acetyltransferase, partial [Candidatus Cellulosilyticum pullistercoris]|nr:GNAT family N-acetyltransferase [Candidatus Cellulosilyticum pullistercoris]
MEFTVRRAKPEDALFLTSISLGTKRYGDYPKESLETGDDELAITEEYIEENIVLIAQKKDTIIGYCSVIEVGESYWRDEAFIKAGYWLDHLFIRPAYIRSGIGSRLIEELVGQCRENNIDKLYILSDPNTNGFYDKIGAIYIQDMPLGIEGSEVCLFELCILQEDVSKIENHTKESDRKQSEIEIEDLSKKRMRLEQEILGQKLYELDKDIDEDDIYDFPEDESEDEEINVDFSEDESDDEEIDVYDNEDSEEAYYPQKYDREHPIVNFDFTTPIGYKFECEETEDTVYET